MTCRFLPSCGAMEPRVEPPGPGPPAELVELLPPDLLPECEREWNELLVSQRELWKQQYGDEYPQEPQLTKPQLEVELQRIIASLAEEEERWGAAAATNERRWTREAEDMFARWRLDDAARMSEQQQHASSEAQRHDLELSELRPAPCWGWASLLRASQLDRVGARRVAELCIREGHAEASAARGGASSAIGVRVPTSSATMSSDRMRRLLGALHEAGGAAALVQEPFCRAICAALAVEADDDEASGTTGVASGGTASALPESGAADSDADNFAAGCVEYEEPPISIAAALCLLLALVEGASAEERLSLLLGAVLPHRAAPRSRASATPLTFAEQRWVYTELTAAARTALAAATSLAHTMASTPKSPSHEGGASTSEMQLQPPGQPPREARTGLDAALGQRPTTWAVCPPDIRAFAVWCATSERNTVGAALVGCKEPEEHDQPPPGQNEVEDRVEHGVEPSSTSDAT